MEEDTGWTQGDSAGPGFTKLCLSALRKPS